MKNQDPDSLLEPQLVAQGDDWVPTPHGRFLAEVLAEHSYARDKHVLELGAGLGNHTIVLLAHGPTSLVATELNEELLASTRENVERNAPGSKVEYRVADWLSTEGTFDLVVTNPPFCKSGKQNRRYFIDSLILDAHKRLRPSGELVFVQSSMADIEKTLRRLAENGFDAEVVDSTQGPFRNYYFEDEKFMREIQDVPGGFERRGSEYWETLYVVHATLQS